MVSATDVITYIGVPLAVLGVSPIFYTFTVALYTRLKVQRILRECRIEPRVRARFMTGIVEVDLPILHLFPLHRTEKQYWIPSAFPKTVAGASWSYLNFERTEMELFTCRLQRSDKISLPEAKISFSDLLYFLQDLGCYPDLDGFHKLRNRGQTIAGISLMLHGNRQQCGGRSILEVAKSGDRHGLTSLRLINHGWLWSSGSIRDSNTILPPFSMSGSLLGMKPGDVYPDHHNSASAIKTPDEAAQPSSVNSSAETRRYFVIRSLGEPKVYISIHEKPPPSKGDVLSPDHLEVLHPALTPQDNSIPDTFWRHWFSCAAIAVYSHEKRQSWYRFLPNQRFLHIAQFYDMKVESAHYYHLFDGYRKDLDERLEYVDDSDLDFLNFTDGPDSSQPLQIADRRQKEWCTKRDVKHIFKRRRRSAFGTYVSDLDIAMPNLTRLCLRRLHFNPINFESLSIGSLPEEPWDLKTFTQHTAKSIVRIAILDVNFAKKLNLQVGRSMVELDHKVDKSGVDSQKTSSQEDSKYFCCIIVLLAIIGQRATYLLSGQDVKHFEEEWSHVYLS